MLCLAYGGAEQSVDGRLGCQGFAQTSFLQSAVAFVYALYCPKEAAPHLNFKGPFVSDLVPRMPLSRAILEAVKPVVERFPRLALTYRSLRDARLLGEVPRKHPMGFFFLGNEETERGEFEIEEVELVRHLLRDTDVCINVGANIGYYCCIALKHGRHVIAFEPIDLNLAYLYKNLWSNGWTNNAEVFPLAISDKTGLIEIFGGGTGASLIKGWANTVEMYKRVIPVSTLDTILGERLSGKQCLVIIDVEGAEYGVLKGAHKLLRQTPKPRWMVEISATEHVPGGKGINPTLTDTFQMFWDHGYESWTADARRLPVAKNDIEDILARGDTTITTTHSFIFVERGEGQYLAS